MSGRGVDLIRFSELGLVDYASNLAAMREFTVERTAQSTDEIWSVTHAPVYTRGQREHQDLKPETDITVVDVDRGGLITYHGPGQAILYLMIDLKRLGIGIRSLVCAIEQSVIDLCESEGIVAERRDDAPGVYVQGRKLASLGLKVRHGRTYHGLAVNVDMDLAPFEAIVPCGLEGIEMTQLSTLGVTQDAQTIALSLARLLADGLGYDAFEVEPR